MDDPGTGKRVACEQRGEAFPWEGLRARPPFQPLLPDPRGLPEVPAQLLHVPRDPVIGIVTFELRRQSGELGAQRLMAVSPAPVVDGDQRAAEPALGRSLPHHVLALAAISPTGG